MTYFIRLKTEFPNKQFIAFEEVTADVFEDREFALNDEGMPRYHNDYIIVDNGEIIHMELSDCHINAIGLICRFLKIPAFTGTMPDGIVRTPSHIRFQKKTAKKDNVWLLECATGIKFKAQKAA